MKKKTYNYDKKKILKPWGFEYTIFRNSDKLELTHSIPIILFSILSLIISFDLSAKSS